MGLDPTHRIVNSAVGVVDAGGGALSLVQRQIKIDAGAAERAAVLVRSGCLGGIFLVPLPSAVFAVANIGVFWIKHRGSPFRLSQSLGYERSFRPEDRNARTQTTESPGIIQEALPALDTRIGFRPLQALPGQHFPAYLLVQGLNPLVVVLVDHDRFPCFGRVIQI